ncbi:hypothetical protein BT96DRAFT_949452 [Gymnopus androsaceus JB14]|uniref:Uncharacterized protein n=1 Tax=Gymnopus androsaceus JB14 TaxID=1447944 RepID=A0A6A4GKQ0_9AGAR|nr:hypothetical protein BT96DRAFT_949452 [Gymnopus androsaceus JB14]
MSVNGKPLGRYVQVDHKGVGGLNYGKVPSLYGVSDSVVAQWNELRNLCLQLGCSPRSICTDCLSKKGIVQRVVQEDRHVAITVMYENKRTRESIVNRKVRCP